MKRLTRPFERLLGRLTSRAGERRLGAAALLAMTVSAVLSLVVAPPDRWSWRRPTRRRATYSG